MSAADVPDSDEPVEDVPVRLYDVVKDGEVVERVHLSEADAERYGDMVRLSAGEEAGELRGAALDAALEEAGLPKSGTADEKRERLGEHLNAQD